jgi:hypothetical protein
MAGGVSSLLSMHGAETLGGGWVREVAHLHALADVGERAAGSQGVGSVAGASLVGMASANGAALLPTGVAPRCGLTAAATVVSGIGEQQG